MSGDNGGISAADLIAIHGQEFLENLLAMNPDLLSKATARVPGDVRGRLVNRKILLDQERDRRYARRQADEEDALYDRPEPVPWDAGTLAEQLLKPEPPGDRIEGLMGWEAFTAIIAMNKTGKTTLCLNLAFSLITGHPFLGEFPVIPVTGRVAFLNFEVSGHQIARWAQQRGIPADRLFIVNLRGAPNPFRDRERLAELAEMLRAQDAETLFVDPFSRAFTGDNQNDNGEVQRWLNQLDEFARGQAGVRDIVLSVHAGWDGSRARGASALQDHPDGWLHLTRTEAGTRHVDAYGRDTELHKRELLLDEDTKTLTLATPTKTSALLSHEELMVRVSEFLGSLPEYHEGAGVNMVKRDVTGNRDQLGDALAALVESGHVTKTPKGQSFLHTLVTPFHPDFDEVV